MARHDNAQAADRRDRSAASGALPDDPGDAIAREAARDAENVAVFLREIGLVPTAGRPVRLPPRFLLQLGAALRLLVWESGGLEVHLASGLPRAEKAIIDAFGLLEAPAVAEAEHPGELPRRVVALFVERFAWHGRRDMDSDVVLDDHVDEDALVDALAELLWDARHVTKPVKEVCDG